MQRRTVPSPPHANRSSAPSSSARSTCARAAFASVIFAVSFAGAPDADLAFGANIAGAMFGGLSEYSSLILGFQYVSLVAMAFYLGSAVAGRRRGAQVGG